MPPSGRATRRCRLASAPAWAGSACPRSSSITRKSWRRSPPACAPRASRPPCSSAWAGARWLRRCCSMRSAPQRAAWSSSSSTRPTRSRSPASATPATRRGRSTSSPPSRARPPRHSASSPSSGTSSTTGAAAPSRSTLRPSPTRARAWRPSHTPTTSGVSSSTRPTWAGGSARSPTWGWCRRPCSSSILPRSSPAASAPPSAAARTALRTRGWSSGSHSGHSLARGATS